MGLGVETRFGGGGDRGQISKRKLCYKGLMKRLSRRSVMMRLTFSRGAAAVHIQG